MMGASPSPVINESNFSTLEKERESQGLNSQRFSMLDGIPSGKYQAGAVAQPNATLAGHGSQTSIPIANAQARQN